MSGHQLFLHSLQQRLKGRSERQLMRHRRHLESPQQVEVVIDGKKLLSFCSNDYLGLANHPDVVAAFKRGADEYGAGSGASHLVTGHPRAHAQLEEELAAFTGRSRALLFGSGYTGLAGLVIDGNKAALEQGDFLIRGIAGGDPDSGAVLVGEHVRVGQVMRLQVRDHESADADLRAVLAQVPSPAAGGVHGRLRVPGGPFWGRLVVSCVWDGRGRQLVV